MFGCLQLWFVLMLYMLVSLPPYSRDSCILLWRRLGWGEDKRMWVDVCGCRWTGDDCLCPRMSECVCAARFCVPALLRRHVLPSLSSPLSLHLSLFCLLFSPSPLCSLSSLSCISHTHCSFSLNLSSHGPRISSLNHAVGKMWSLKLSLTFDAHLC